MKLKSCRACKKELELEQFSAAKSNKDGHNNTCKPCVVARNRNYWRTPYGRISYIVNVQRNSSRARGHSLPDYDVNTLYVWALDNGLTNIHRQWAEAGYCKDLAPSIDRIGVLRGYSFDNIRLVTWRDNNDAQYTDRKNCKVVTRQNRSVRQLSLAGELIAVHRSIASAARLTGSVRTNINCMCTGTNPNIKSVNGFLWEYAE